jgi:hypothetical protein
MSWLLIEDQGEVIPAAIRDFSFGAALPTGWTLTRDGAALGRSPVDGRWVSYPANTARPSINPLTLANDGILIEPGANQLVYNSWSPNIAPNNSTYALDAAIQTPFGLGAMKLTPTATLSTHGWNFFFETNRAATIPDNSTVALNIVLKPVGAYTRGRFAILGRDGLYRLVSFSLTGGGAITSTSGTLISATVEPDTDGFFAIKIVLNFGIGTSGHACNLAIATDTDERTFSGDGTSHFLVGYLGAEIGDTVTSPIITTGVSLTRPADSLKAGINWSQDHGLSVGIDYTPLTRGPFTVVHAANAVTGNSSLELLNRPEGALYRAVALGASSALLDAPIPPVGVGRTTVISAGPDYFRLAIDGVQLGVDANGAMPLGLTTLTIGAAGDSSVGRGAMVVRRIKTWDVTLEQDAIETFSGDLSVAGEVPDTPILDVQQSRIVLPEETSVTLVLTLDRSSANSAVSYRTVDDTAKAGVDYAGTSGTLYFEIGETAAQVTILMAERALSEDKTFRFELYNPVNCALANSSCTVVLQRVIPAGTVATTKFDFDTATLSPDWTLTRASAANARNASGLWQSVAANLPRLHYHAPGISGLFLEPLASEQRLFDSVDAGFAAVASTKTAVTTEQTATGMRQLQWRKDATVADHKLTGVLAAPNADMPTGEFTFWFLARPVNHPRWKLRVKGIDNVWRETRVNLSGPGSVIASETGTTAYATQDPHFATWYQFGLYRTQTVSAGVSAEFELFPVNEDGTSSTAGDTTHGIDICHAQLEPVSGMTSPIIATAAAAKTPRSADVFKATPTATWFKHAAYTIGLHFIRLRDRPITQRLLMIKDQSVAIAPDDIGFVTTPASLQARIKVQNSGTGAIPAIPNITSTDLTTAGIADTAMLVVSPAKVAVYHNGNTVGETAALTTAPVVPGALRIGSSEPSGNDPMSLLVLRVYHWNHAIPEVDAKLFSGNLGFVPVGAPPKPIVSIPTALSVAEGGIINVPVSRTGTAACQVNIRTLQNTATVTADYIGVGPIAVNFALGEAQKLVPIQTVPDTVADPGEKFNVRLELIAGNDTCVLGNATCAVTILEPPRVDIATAVNATEGQNAVITVTKTGVGACSVTYRTVGDTATTADLDYTGIGATTLAFAENEASKTVSVAVLQDNKADSSQKFKVVLENPTGCSLGVATCTVTIFDVGVEPTPVGTLYETPIVFAQFKGTATTPSVDFGVGGQPYYVTTTEDHPTAPTQGMLRHALNQTNRVIVFEVGGLFKISQTAPLRLDNTDLLIAGETAPYPGVIIQDGQIDIRAAASKQPLNICMRHVTIERGYDTRDEFNNRADCISLQAFKTSGGAGPVSNVWIDHCALFWAMDECVEVYSFGATSVMENISFSNTIFSESLYKPETVTNPLTGQKFYGKWEGGTKATSYLESEHNYGFIINPYGYRVDLQYCLFTDMFWRVPVLAGNTRTVLANTVALNCRLGCTTGGGSTEDYDGPLLVTVEGYLCISGPNTGIGSKHSGFRFWSRAGGKADGFRDPGQPAGSPGAFATGSKAWVKNLYGWKGAKSTYYQPLTSVLGLADSATLTATEQKVLDDATVPPINIPGAPVVALSADDLYTRACLNVGPRPKERVSHVKRVADKLIAKDSAWVNHELDVGGFSNGTKWGDHGNKYPVTNTTRSLRSQNAANPPKFKDGTVIPAFPTHTDKAAVRAWLRRFLDEVQYD